MVQASVPQQGTIKTVRGNRRATVRYRCAPATIGKVFLNEDHEFQRACIVNLSAQGIGLQLTREIDSGQFVQVLIKSNNGSKTFELSAQVAHSSRLPHGEWYLGCELTTPLSTQDLDDLL